VVVVVVVVVEAIENVQSACKLRGEAHTPSHFAD